MPKVVQILRRWGTGVVECVCEHGVGHPCKELSKLDSSNIHGCDGCCSHKDFKPSAKQIKEFEDGKGNGVI